MTEGELYVGKNTLLIIGAIEVVDEMTFCHAIEKWQGVYTMRYIAVEVKGNQYKRAILNGKKIKLFEFQLTDLGYKLEKKIDIKKYKEV